MNPLAPTPRASYADNSSNKHSPKSDTLKPTKLFTDSYKRRRLILEPDEEEEENHPPTSTTPSKIADLFNGEKCSKRRRCCGDDAEEPSDDEVDYDYSFAARLKHVKQLITIDDTLELIFGVRVILYEYVKDNDIYAANGSSSSAKKSGPRWVKRGAGKLEMFKDKEEGYHCGTVRMSMRKEGTVQKLMDHIIEPNIQCQALPKKERSGDSPRKRTTSYTWIAVDYAYTRRHRHFAARFDSEQDALEWKDRFEQGKQETLRARKGLDMPDTSAGDEVCELFKSLSTSRGGVLPTSPPHQEK